VCESADRHVAAGVSDPTRTLEFSGLTDTGGLPRRSALDAYSGHDGPVKTVTIDWDPVAERFVSEGTIRGRRIDINAPHVLPDGEGRHGPSGYSASELLLAAVGSCAAWDVIEIARKQRQNVTGLSVAVDGDQHTDAPWAFHTVALRFTVHGRGLDRAGLGRAIELAVDRYCSVVATIRGVADVSAAVELIEETDVIDQDVFIDASPDVLGA
jgi:putative redox protein